MCKGVTVTVLSRNGDEIRMRLSSHYNERTGKFLSDTVVSVSARQFFELAADHNLTPDDFPVGCAVPVTEPA